MHQSLALALLASMTLQRGSRRITQCLKASLEGAQEKRSSLNTNIDCRTSYVDFMKTAVVDSGQGWTVREMHLTIFTS